MLSATSLIEKLKIFFATQSNIYIVIAIAVAVVALIVIVLVSAPKKKRDSGKVDDGKVAEPAPSEVAETTSSTEAPVLVVPQAAEASAQAEPKTVEASAQTEPKGTAVAAEVLEASNPKKGERVAEPAKAEGATKNVGTPVVETSAKASASVVAEGEDDEDAEPILSEDDGKETRPGVVEILKNAQGDFRFRFRAMNGSIVGHSQCYKSKDSCKNGIRSVVATCLEAEIVDTTKKDVEYLPTIGKAVFEIFKDNGGKFRFRLTAKNATNILASQGYSAKASCFNGAESIKRMAQNHTIEDSTLVRKPKNVK